MATKNQYCTIYLIRHGETEWNAIERIQGQSDSPLTSTGKLQAKNTAQQLKNVKFSAAYSSDLGRAHQTAATIALEHQLTVTTTKLIRERHHGILEGHLWTELQLELKDELARREALSFDERFHHKFSPDYESDSEVVGRTLTFLRQTALAHLNESILVVTHGGIMKSLLIHLGFATYQEFSTSGIANTAFVILRSDGTDFFIDKTVGIIKKS